MQSLTCTEFLKIQDIYDGSLTIAVGVPESMALVQHAKNIVEDIFQNQIDLIGTEDFSDVQQFVQKAKQAKSKFTNDSLTREILVELIKKRYSQTNSTGLLYDVPRLRIVPNSDFLSSGISYNYKAHRDTWYGGGQEQINHWMPVANVTPNSTFYITPEYFHKPIGNNSEIFDLDEWDTKYRTLAEQNIGEENRPHPVPTEALSDDKNYYILLPIGTEFVFSGHHLHGSGKNTTNKVRFSVDYRVDPISSSEYHPPVNLDSRATGNYKKYMAEVK